MAITERDIINTSWWFFRDWGCDGSYDMVALHFNTNDTFSTNDTEGPTSGQCYEREGMIIFKYDSPSRKIFAGNLAGKTITGICVEFNDPGAPFYAGCFYMLQKGTPIPPHSDS